MTSKDRKIKTNLVIGDIVKVLSPLFRDYYKAKIINIVINEGFHIFTLIMEIQKLFNQMVYLNFQMN